jgi:hypothetical protein
MRLLITCYLNAQQIYNYFLIIYCYFSGSRIENSFDIFSLGGESKITPFIRGLREGRLTDAKMYIAIYDNDDAGTRNIR